MQAKEREKEREKEHGKSCTQRRRRSQEVNAMRVAASKNRYTDYYAVVGGHS